MVRSVCCLQGRPAPNAGAQTRPSPLLLRLCMLRVQGRHPLVVVVGAGLRHDTGRVGGREQRPTRQPPPQSRLLLFGCCCCMRGSCVVLAWLATFLSALPAVAPAPQRSEPP